MEALSRCYRCGAWSFVIVAWLAAAVPILPAAGPADVRGVSCKEFLVPKVEIKGKQVGQDDCRMIETDFDIQGRKFRRMDMGISGTIDGYIVKEGRYNHYFGSNPEFTYPQAGNKNPMFYGIGRYDAEKGSALIFIYPVDRSAWNGKMFVTAHGAGVSFKVGNLKVWDKNLNPSNPLSDIDAYEKLMLEKGYAVAKTRRSTPMESGDTVVTLEDGTVIPEANVTEQPRLIMSFAKVGWNVLEKRLERKPSRTYWYGHSGGARPGRIVNYQPCLNVDTDGKHIIDGLLIDDAGSGLWLPVVMKDGKDILFTNEKCADWFPSLLGKSSAGMAYYTPNNQNHRDWIVPAIELAHLLYVNETPDNPPPWASTNFLMNKRLNAKYLRDKGLADKFRTYEVAGVSHNGGEMLPEGKRGDVEIVVLARVYDGLIDLLDNWVEKGIAPPPTKSDWAELGGVNKDGEIENGAVRMPEIACPLGVYYIFPPSAGPSGEGTTGFAPFDGKGLEPYDGRGPVKSSEDNWYYNFVDMNRNGYRDFRETVTQAWRRLGLLQRNETFSREKYTACVQKAVNKLLADKLITARTAKFYADQAANTSFPSN